MNLDQFVAANAGKPLDLDGEYGPQCVDLVNAYARDVLHAPLFGGNAIDIWSRYPAALYTKVENTPRAVPLPGDIIIWGGPNAVVGTTIYGHIAVVLSATVSTFVSFDQNWPEQSFCHKQAHTYDAVVGWLMPNVLRAPPVAPLPPKNHPPVNAADVVETLRRHAAALTDHPSVQGTNDLLAAIKTWPHYAA
jgi:hypothetical protein